MSSQESLTILREKLCSTPEQVEFDEVIKVISCIYHYTPTKFINGMLHNEAGKNEGSCKIFSFAKQNGLSEQQTLFCFGKYYRDDVLTHPDGEDHQNIRNFMKTGWAAISFEHDALRVKE